MEKILSLKCKIGQKCSYQYGRRHPHCCFDCDRAEKCDLKCLNTPNKCGQVYAYHNVPNHKPQDCYYADEYGACMAADKEDIACKRCKFNV